MGDELGFLCMEDSETVRPPGTPIPALPAKPDHESVVPARYLAGGSCFSRKHRSLLLVQRLHSDGTTAMFAALLLSRPLSTRLQRAAHIPSHLFCSQDTRWVL